MYWFLHNLNAAWQRNSNGILSKYRNKRYNCTHFMIYQLTHSIRSRIIDNGIIIAQLGMRSAQREGRDNYGVLNYARKSAYPVFINPRDIMNVVTGR